MGPGEKIIEGGCSGCCLARFVVGWVAVLIVLRRGWRSGALVSAISAQTADQNAHAAAHPANPHLRLRALHGWISESCTRLDRTATRITLTFMQQ